MPAEAVYKHAVATAQRALEAERERLEMLGDDARTAWRNAEERQRKVLAQEKESLARIAAERARLAEEKEKMATHVLGDSAGIVDLDVGGEYLRTYGSTLRNAGGMLGAMFSGRHDLPKTPEGRYFIDFDGRMFRRILQYLRLGRPEGHDHHLYDDQFAQALEFFGLTSSCTEH